MKMALGVWIVLSLCGVAGADVFNMGGTRNPDGSWTGLASLETVLVANPGNLIRYPLEPECDQGVVNYVYNIGKYEVTAGQYCEFLNAVAATDTYGLYSYRMHPTYYGSRCHIEQTGISGSYTYTVASDWANRPVGYVNWGDAARFCNWLHNDQPSGAQDLTTTEDGAYFLNGAITDEEFFAVNREADWKWALPDYDEWYKAAYHKNEGIAGNYFEFPTSSDVEPSNDLVDPDPGNNATFLGEQEGEPDCTIGDPYYRTEVGAHENSASPYGTFDQGGNVLEWTERMWQNHGVGCLLLGGSYALSADYMSGERDWFDGPAGEYSTYGFRVCAAWSPGDFSGDRLVNMADVDMLWAVRDTDVPLTDGMYDLAANGHIDLGDAKELIQNIVGTSMADTNLDGIVDLRDLCNLADRYGRTGDFGDGDANFDGVIDIFDLGEMADDYGKTFAGGPIPEPTSLALLALGAVAVIRRRCV